MDDGIGTHTSIALDSNDNPHICYATYGVLKYAYYDGGWHIETVDSDINSCNDVSLALDINDNPHISYYNQYDLKYAYYDGAWHRERLDIIANAGVAQHATSIALDTNDNPHISYYDSANHDLKYAYYDSSWHLETVDAAGDVGLHTSIVLDNDGNPHISYFDRTNIGLKYAYKDDSWQTLLVNSDGWIGKSTSIALDVSGNPHIIFSNTLSQGTTSKSNLKHTYYNGSWETETVDYSSDVGRFSSLDLDSNNNPHICYYDINNTFLKYAYYNGIWHTENIGNSRWGDCSIAIDSNDNPHISYRNFNLNYAYYDGFWHTHRVGTGGKDNSLVLDGDDKPRISYFDTSDNTVRYAWCDVECGNTNNWHTVVVDNLSSNGGYTSLALDSNDKPHISYVDSINDSINYAWCDVECGNTSNWDTVIIDAIGNYSGYPSIILDSSDNPHISYSKPYSDLMYAHYDNTWHKEIVDDFIKSYPFYTSIALDAKDNPSISYYDHYDDLGYAYYDGTSWYVSKVDSLGFVGTYPSLSLDSSSNLHISYYNYSNRDLMYAYNMDLDDDGINHNDDNCLGAYNPGQVDTDGDGRGDACDDDGDDDGILNDEDNCPLIVNPDQEDADDDGVGDLCDNCINVANPGQIDVDEDGLGAVCDNCPDVYNPDQTDTDSDWIGDVCDNNPYLPALTPAVDGHYTYWQDYCCEDDFYGDSYVINGIRVAPYYTEYIWCGWFCGEGYSESLSNGIVEFNISSVEGLFTSGQIQAYLYLTAKDVWLSGEKCFFIYSVHDENENGVIEEIDVDTDDFIGEICEDLQPGDSITFDVTTAVEHDLFGPDQTSFSSFVIKISSDSSDYPDDYMEF